MPDALVDIKNHIMTVTLNRPKRMNAISGPMIVRMYDAFVEASANDDIRCVIVTGAEGNFTSGADLKACLLYTSPSPRDRTRSRMPSSA